ncbi:Uncharacterised protein [Streptococcus equi subsp. equi]|nr:Uncharacterised protein [Streptococcus equi subsp. equi]CRT73005.1 Uncharacterised protein [Streptococcus equi subsp. equi]
MLLNPVLTALAIPFIEVVAEVFALLKPDSTAEDNLLALEVAEVAAEDISLVTLLDRPEAALVEFDCIDARLLLTPELIACA